MVLTAAALVVGVVAGLVVGSQHRHLAEPTLRVWPLLAAGLVLQALAGPTGADALVLAGYCVLAAFVVANLRLVGMPIVLIGLSLNLFVIALNGGMPVRASALRAAGLANADDL